MIFVDDLNYKNTSPLDYRIRAGDVWCLMKSNSSVEELRDFANRLSLKEDRISTLVPREEFCVLNEEQRELAISLGAIPVERSHLSDICHGSDAKVKQNLHDHYVDGLDLERDKSKYDFSNTEYCKNKYILEWWTQQHDKIIADQIDQYQWTWHYIDESRRLLLDATPPDLISRWKELDPLCHKYAWYNILWNFMRSRALDQGLINRIREVQWHTCPMCGKRFREDSVKHGYVRYLGIDHIDICNPCLETYLDGSETVDAIQANARKRTVWIQSESHRTEERDSIIEQINTKDYIVSYVQKLADLLRVIPPQDFDARNYLHTSTERRVKILQVNYIRPMPGYPKRLFGTWLQLLIDSKILEDGTRRTSRGTQCFANDGHFCRSLGEKTIDDFLSANQVRHEIEPKYPEGGYRADFKVGDIFIEYFGLAGDSKYDAKINIKNDICQRHGIKLIHLYAIDLISNEAILKKLEPCLNQTT